MAEVKRYLRGDAVRVEADITDSSDVPVSPSSISVSIYDPNGAQVVNEATMTASSTVGTYYYVYSTSATALTGFWTARVTSTVTSVTGRQTAKFEIYAET